MLHLNKHHLHLPHIPLPSLHTMQLSPVADDDDELTTAIINDPVTHDNNWQLGDPDTKELEKFWSDVEDDVRNDPEWVRFSED